MVQVSPANALERIPPSAAPFFTAITLAYLVERRAGWLLPFAEETMLLGRRVGAAQAGAHLLVTLAMHARMNGNLDRALHLLATAAAEFRALGDRYGEALAAAQCGHASRSAGEYSDSGQLSR